VGKSAAVSLVSGLSPTVTTVPRIRVSSCRGGDQVRRNGGWGVAVGLATTSGAAGMAGGAEPEERQRSEEEEAEAGEDGDGGGMRG
jgi:hypothetical protein